MARSLCHRFGPGRLPHANRRDVGGGIAMAANALLAAVLWYGVAGVVLTVGGIGEIATSTDFGFAVAGSVFVAPFALPCAFVVGTLCWRHLVPDDPDPTLGAVGGALTAGASLVVGAVGAGLVFGAFSLMEGDVTAIQELLPLVALVAVFAFAFGAIFVGWLAVPLAAFGGWYHERAKRRRTCEPEARSRITG